MNGLDDHKMSSDWKLAMDAISHYFKGLVDLFPSTSSGYCILLHGRKHHWNINQLISKLEAEALPEFSLPLVPPFWWKEWEGLLKTLESEFEINFPKETYRKEKKNQALLLTTTKLNPNLPVEKIAEAVSRLSSSEVLSEEFFSLETTTLEDDMKTDDWSSRLIEQTKQILNDLPISAFLREGHCILKSPNHQYGKISIHDAISYEYKIRDIDSGELLYTFDTLEDLIEAGWVVDLK